MDENYKKLVYEQEQKQLNNLPHLYTEDKKDYEQTIKAVGSNPDDPNFGVGNIKNYFGEIPK